MGTAAVDLARYQYLPLNAFRWVQLLNTVVIPRWMYRTLFLPNDSMFKAMDPMCFRFVLMAEGMELNKVDVHQSYNVLHFLVHGGCPPASITQKRPNHGQVSVHGEPKFIEGQQPYVQ